MSHPYAPSYARWPTRRLVRAVRAQDWGLASQAIGQSADPDVVIKGERDGRPVKAPALFWAVAAGASPVVQALLEANASVTTRLELDPLQGASHGATVLDWVTRETDLLALLRAGLGQFVPCGNSARDTVLHVAAEHGWLQVVRLVVERTGMAAVRNAFGQTPLHASVRVPHPPRDRTALRRTMDYLIQSGCPLEAKDEVGETALMTAATHAPQMMGVLVRAGADTRVLTPSQRQTLALLAPMPTLSVSYLSPR